MFWWLLGALAVGALIALGIKLTAQVIRDFRTRRRSKILIADMESFIRNMPDRERHSISFADLEACSGQQFISEFDPYTNEVICTKLCDKGMDYQIYNLVSKHGGYIIIGD